MLRLVTSAEARKSQADALGMIYEGKIDTTSTWVETSALLITRVTGEPFQQYFMIVMTNDLTEDDIDELRRLERELGESLSECVVERERHQRAHRRFPGSTYFDLVTVYAG